MQRSTWFLKHLIHLKTNYWCYIGILWLINSPLSHTTPNTGTIQDTEWVIQKQQNNSVNQEKRLYIKAPLPLDQENDTPLIAELQEQIPFDRVAIAGQPLEDKNPQTLAPVHYDGLLGVHTFGLPHIQGNLYNLPLFKGFWHTHLSYMPTYLHQIGTIHIQSKYTIKTFQLTCKTAYDYHRYIHHALQHIHNFYHYTTSIMLQNSHSQSGQKGQITYSPILSAHYGNEHRLAIDYQWIKPNLPSTYQVDTHYTLAHYAQQSRHLLAIIPQYKRIIQQSYVLHMQLAMQYHNHHVPALACIQLYPSLKIEEAKTQRYYFGLSGFGLSHTIKPMYLQTLLYKQPFMLDTPPLQHRYQGLTCYGGYQDTILKALHYHINLIFSQKKYLGRILPHQDIAYYTYNYTDHHYNHYSLKLKAYTRYTFSYAPISLTSQFVLYKYFNNIDLPIWWYHKPALKGQFSILYKPIPKLTLTGYGYICSKTTIKDQQGQPTPLAPQCHLTLKAQYTLKGPTSLFATLDNLLNRQYRTYRGYLYPPLNLTIGIQYH